MKICVFYALKIEVFNFLNFFFNIKSLKSVSRKLKILKVILVM